jgi:hypothetical protein
MFILAADALRPGMRVLAPGNQKDGQYILRRNAPSGKWTLESFRGQRLGGRWVTGWERLFERLVWGGFIRMVRFWRLLMRSKRSSFDHRR